MNEQFTAVLGPVPHDWEGKTIGELAIHVGSGITPTGGSDVYTDSGVMFIRSQNVTNDGLLLDDVAFIDKKTHYRMKGSEVFAFDVLLNITGASIGRCCYLPSGLGSTNVNQHVCAIRLPTASKADAKYLASVLASPIGQNQIFRLNAGGNREGLNYQQLRVFRIPWPPRECRAGIARILTTVDNLIEKTEALIAKYQAIKQGMMHDLFTRGVDEHGHLRPPYDEAPELYKQSELGWIPKEWRETTIGNELHGIDAGKSPDCPDIPAPPGEWGVLKVSAVQPDGFRSTENKVVLNPVWVNPAFEVKEGDLLISRSNTYQLVGLVCHVHSPQPRLMLCDKTLRLCFNPREAAVSFMFWLFQQPIVRRHIEVHATGTSGSMKNISQPVIRSARIMLPPVEEQERITDRIEAIQDNIAAQRRTQEKLMIEKTGLMQDLLTGKVRVKVDEAEEVVQ